jgi:glutamine cyclotransferase
VLRLHRLDVLARLPHPGRGFTQGLLLAGGAVWESTGLYGESSLRSYQPGAAGPVRCLPLLPEYFGEGICLAGGVLWQLTWQERVALRWDPGTLAPPEPVGYNREGWGMCATAGLVLTSDGSSELVLRDPQTLQPFGVIAVRCEGRRLDGLNDLEWSGGRVWANLLGRPYLAGIDHATGQVTDVVDARAIRERHPGDPEAVLNGIAALPAAGEFLLTGKRWRYLYRVRLAGGEPASRPRRLLSDLLG